MIRLHISYAGMHWICGGIGVVSTAILLFKSPFPRYIKLSLPFTFFLFYQYSIVARSYVLAPMFLFLAVAWWKKRPVTVCVLLGLLSNLSLHAAVISGGFAIVFLKEHIQDKSLNPRNKRRRLLKYAFVLLTFYAFSIWTAWPPADLKVYYAVEPSQRLSPLVRALAVMIQSVCQPSLSSPLFLTAIITLLFWTTVVMVFWNRGGLIYLLPIILFVLFSAVVVATYWHFGLLVIALICSLWLTWPRSYEPRNRWETFARIAIVYVIGVQIVWSAFAVYYDHRSLYSPDEATAAFLSPSIAHGATVAVVSLNGSDERVATTIGILPYFNRNLFVNLRTPFFWWSRNDPSKIGLDDVLLLYPDIVIGETNGSGSDKGDEDPLKLARLHRAGYVPARRFCGSLPFRTELWLTYCHTIFERKYDR
jgi:hypothetical protein